MAKKAYFAIEPINHDGKDYAVGDKIELESDEARHLKEWNAISSKAPGADEEQEPGKAPE